MRTRGGGIGAIYRQPPPPGRADHSAASRAGLAPPLQRQVRRRPNLSGLLSGAPLTTWRRLRLPVITAAAAVGAAAAAIAVSVGARSPAVTR